MRMVWLAMVAGSLAADLAGGTIGTQINSLGGNTYQENFLISGFTFSANDTLDVVFDHTLYGSLSLVGVTLPPSNQWSVLLDQPNHPTAGFDGDYLLTALVDNPSLAGPFSVHFTFLGTGTPSGSQQFTIFDSNFNDIGSGTTGVPEPASLSLVLGGLLVGAAVWRARRRA
jgi:hypothetical protein